MSENAYGYTPEKVTELVAELLGFAAGSESARATLMRDAAAALTAVSAERDAAQRKARTIPKRLRAERDRLHKAITEEIEYLEGFRPDHAEHIMLLTGKSLDRLRAALNKEGNDDE